MTHTMVCLETVLVTAFTSCFWFYCQPDENIVENRSLSEKFYKQITKIYNFHWISFERFLTTIANLNIVIIWQDYKKNKIMNKCLIITKFETRWIEVIKAPNQISCRLNRNNMAAFISETDLQVHRKMFNKKAKIKSSPILFFEKYFYIDNSW